MIVAVTKRLLLLFCSTLLAVAFAEGLIRLVALLSWTAGTQPPPSASIDSEERSEVSLRELIQPTNDRDLVYTLRPNLETWFKGVSVRTNSLGLRERELLKKKLAHKTRILGLGDSVMFGWGVESVDTYLRLVERELNKNGHCGPVITVNCGVPGYNTAMEVAQFKRIGSEFKPDLVVLHMVNNDLEPPRFLSTRPQVSSLRRSFLLELFRDQRLKVHSNPLIDPREVEGFDDRRRGEIAAQHRHLSGENAMNDALENLQSLAGNTPVICLVLTRDTEPWKGMAEAAEQRGFFVVSTGKLFSARLAELYDHPDSAAWKATYWLSEDDPHPNVFAHELLARCVLDTIEERRLLVRTD